MTFPSLKCSIPRGSSVVSGNLLVSLMVRLPNAGCDESPRIGRRSGNRKFTFSKTFYKTSSSIVDLAGRVSSRRALHSEYRVSQFIFNGLSTADTPSVGSVWRIPYRQGKRSSVCAVPLPFEVKFVKSSGAQDSVTLTRKEGEGVRGGNKQVVERC